MKSSLPAIYAALLITALASAARAETVVIVNPGNPVAALNREQVVDIYLGRQLTFPNGNTALPIDLPPDSGVRARFYLKLVSRSIAQINAYWARLLFTGRATPPRVLGSAPAVLKSVRENLDAIAYLNSDEVDARVKVVYRIK